MPVTAKTIAKFHKVLAIARHPSTGEGERKAFQAVADRMLLNHPELSLHMPPPVTSTPPRASPWPVPPVSPAPAPTPGHNFTGKPPGFWSDPALWQRVQQAAGIAASLYEQAQKASRPRKLAEGIDVKVRDVPKKGTTRFYFDLTDDDLTELFAMDESDVVTFAQAVGEQVAVSISEAVFSDEDA